MTSGTCAQAHTNDHGEEDDDEAIELVDSVIDIMKENLEAGDDVLVTGFGKWVVREKPSRPGRNPATGEVIKIAPRRVVTFKPSAVLRSALNDGR